MAQEDAAMRALEWLDIYGRSLTEIRFDSHVLCRCVLFSVCVVWLGIGVALLVHILR